MDAFQIDQSLRDFLQLRLIDVAGAKITVGTIAVFVAVLAASYLISRAIRRGLDRWLRSGPLYSEASSKVTQKLVHYAVMLIGSVAALQVVGIDLSTVFAAGAVFAVGLGFAMQTVAQNFVSGVILMVERSIKPGDVLEFDGQVVRVEKMGIRSTIVRTRHEEEMIVPNSTLVQGTVKNFTMSDRLHLVGADVGVVYRSDMRLVQQTLEDTARALPWRVKDRDPLVLLLQFGSSSVDFGVFVWTADPWMSRRLLADLRERIWWALKDAGITIAFPQVDVHFDQPVEESLRLVAAGGSRARA
jgi:small-conductance mechanosensitive channel